jgi:O-antigen ligase
MAPVAVQTPEQHSCTRNTAQAAQGGRLTRNELVVPILLAATAIAFPFGSSPITALNGLGGLRWFLLAAFAAIEARAVLRERSTWMAQVEPGIYHLGWVIFAGIAIASTIWSLTPSSTLGRSLSIVLLTVAVFGSIWRYVRHEQRIKTLGVALLIGLVVSIAVSLLLAIGDPAVGRQTDGRWRGIYLSANELGFQMQLAVPLAVTAAIFARRRIMWLLPISIIVGLALTGSRSTTVFGIAVAVAVLRLNGRLRVPKRFAIAFTVLLVTAGSVYLTVNAQVLRLGTLETLGGRSEAWDRVVLEASSRPLLGSGFATEQPLLAKYRRADLVPTASGSATPPTHRSSVSRLVSGAIAPFRALGSLASQAPDALATVLRSYVDASTAAWYRGSREGVVSAAGLGVARAAGGLGLAIAHPHKTLDRLIRTSKKNARRGQAVGEVSPELIRFPLSFKQFVGGFVENSYLGAIAQLGLVGGLLLVWQLSLPLAAITRLRQAADPWVVAFGVMTAGALLTASFESFLWSAGNLATFAVWTGAAIVARSYSAQRRAPVDAYAAREG